MERNSIEEQPSSLGGGTRLSPLFTWRGLIAESDLLPTTRLVAFALSLHMNERGGSAFPSQATLASETGLAKRTVSDHLRILREEGYLKALSHAHRGRSIEWAATAPEEGSRETTTFQERMSFDDTKGSRETAPQDVIEDVKRASLSQREDRKTGRTDPVWDALAEHFHPQTPSENSNVGKTARELRVAWAASDRDTYHAVPAHEHPLVGSPGFDQRLAAEIHRRMAAYWPGLTKTPQALRNRWSELGRRADEAERGLPSTITREAMLARNGPCQSCSGQGSMNDVPFSCPDCGGTGIEGWVS